MALGSLVLHQRERPCALEPRDGGILLTTLRTHDEIRSSAGLFDKSLPKPDKGMLEIAEKIIAQQEGKFDPSHFKDRYEDALRELIERKKKGKPIEAEEPEAKGENVIDLMDALRSSLEGRRRRRREPNARRLPASAPPDLHPSSRPKPSRSEA